MNTATSVAIYGASAAGATDASEKVPCDTCDVGAYIALGGPAVIAVVCLVFIALMFRDIFRS